MALANTLRIFLKTTEKHPNFVKNMLIFAIKTSKTSKKHLLLLKNTQILSKTWHFTPKKTTVRQNQIFFAHKTLIINKKKINF